MFWRLTLIFCLVLSFSAVCAENPQKILTKMHDFVENTNYGIVFVSQDENLRETISYRQAWNKQTLFAQMFFLDGITREILLKNDRLTYVQENLVPFSLPGKRIIDSFPTLISGNFNQLNNYYDFEFRGNGRMLNQHCYILVITPKKQDRYNYVAWIDQENYFPMRVDLLDDKGNSLRQFRVVSFEKLEESRDFIDAIEQKPFPPAANTKTKEILSKDKSWVLFWLPDGFKEISRYTHPIDEQHFIESALYSDGLFSFSVNVSSKNKLNEHHVYQQGAKTILIDFVKNKEVVFIGDLPKLTAEKIIKNIRILD